MTERDPLDHLGDAENLEHPDPQFAERLIDSLLSELAEEPDLRAPSVTVIDLQNRDPEMTDTQTEPTRRSPRFIFGAAAAAIVLVAGVAIGISALGDDDGTVVGTSDGTSAEYCNAGQSLESSINTLVGLVGVDDPLQAVDLAAQQTSVVTMNDDLELAVAAVEADIDALRESATEVAAGEVAALDQAMDDLNDALATLNDNLFGSSQNADLDNAAAAQDAAQGVVAAAQAVYATLTDCP